MEHPCVPYGSEHWPCVWKGNPGPNKTVLGKVSDGFCFASGLIGLDYRFKPGLGDTYLIKSNSLVPECLCDHEFLHVPLACLSLGNNQFGLQALGAKRGPNGSVERRPMRPMRPMHGIVWWHWFVYVLVYMCVFIRFWTCPYIEQIMLNLIFQTILSTYMVKIMFISIFLKKIKNQFSTFCRTITCSLSTSWIIISWIMWQLEKRVLRTSSFFFGFFWRS